MVYYLRDHIIEHGNGEGPHCERDTKFKQILNSELLSFDAVDG